MPNLYIIGGCNGVGKTTASLTVLPKILDCKEFVNADNIAAGLSPFNPSSVALEAGRIMLQRIKQLMQTKVDFAFETTLSTRSYRSFITEAQQIGYDIILLFFWIDSPALAIQRVAERVNNGGHHIPADVIERRYYRGIYNLLNLYIPVCDSWIIIDNRDLTPQIIATGEKEVQKVIINNEIWGTIHKQSEQHG